MKLPKNEIGVSDCLQWRECPRRMEFGMARHTAREVEHPETGKIIVLRERPEAQSSAAAYGSAIHDAVSLMEEESLTDEEAVRAAFRLYPSWLEPADLGRLATDLETYHSRDYKGVRTMVAEEDWRVPLTVYKGETIYFRFKLDRLYQRLDNEARFIHIDYKSSRYAKSQQEVNEDLQMVAYNFGIFEVFPECEHLTQVYDQLRYGTVIARQKTEKERAEMKEWLAQVAVAIIEDEDHLPRHNEWCAWCPLKMNCPVIEELSDYALKEIAVIAPEEKEGRSKKVALDLFDFDEYTQRLERASDARKVLEAFEKAVKSTLKTMPEDRRTALGYGLRSRRETKWSALALQEAHELLGDDFYSLISLTKSKLESNYPDEDGEALIGRIVALAEEAEGAVSVVPT